MNKYFLLLAFFSTAIAQAAKDPVGKPIESAAIPDRNIKYYEIGKTDGPWLFSQKIQYKKLPDSTLSATSVAVNPKGEVMFNETIIYKGHEPISQVVDVQQSKRHLELEVKDGEVFLRTSSLASIKPPLEEPKEDREVVPQNFITGPLAEIFVQEHFNELMNGDTISAKMAIIEIRDIVTFKFWKKEMVKENGRDVMIVAMKPSSFFISLLVDTIYLHIDVKDKKMVHYVGRTPLWKEENGKIKALDAEIVFE